MKSAAENVSLHCDVAPCEKPCPKCGKGEIVSDADVIAYRMCQAAIAATNDIDPDGLLPRAHLHVNTAALRDPANRKSEMQSRSNFKTMIRISAMILLSSAPLVAHAGGWIPRPPTPPPTNAPPIVVPTNAVPTAWTVQSVWSRSLPWKAKLFHPVPGGELIATYDRNSRKNAEIHVRINGTVQPAIYRGPEETIGDYQAEEIAATDHQNRTYLTAERGERFMVYDHATRTLSKGAKVPVESYGDYRWNVESAFWSKLGRPVAGASGKGTKAALVDMTSGQIVHRFNTDGLIAWLAEGQDGEMWAAVPDGDWGLYSTAGHRLRGIKPASVAAWGPRDDYPLLVGSQTNGGIYRVYVKEKTRADYRKIADLRASKVNQMRIKDGWLYVAASRPDTLARIDLATERVEIIARWEDEAQVVSGEQFDTGIQPCPDGTVLGFRAHAKGCEFVIARPK